MPQRSTALKKTVKWITGPIRRKLLVRKVKKRRNDAEKRFFAFDFAAEQEERAQIIAQKQAKATHRRYNPRKTTSIVVQTSPQETDFRAEAAKSNAAWIRHSQQLKRLQPKKK